MKFTRSAAKAATPKHYINLGNIWSNYHLSSKSSLIKISEASWKWKSLPLPSWHSPSRPTHHPSHVVLQKLIVRNPNLKNSALTKKPARMFAMTLFPSSLISRWRRNATRNAFKRQEWFLALSNKRNVRIFVLPSTRKSKNSGMLIDSNLKKSFSKHLSQITL